MHSIGEEFSTVPIGFDSVIYVMGDASGTVFAISADDGSVIGTVNLKSDSLFSADANAGVNKLDDGILFNTRNEIVIYEAK